ELVVAQPEAAVLFREDDPEPAELGHLLPQRAREAVRVPAVAQRANPFERRIVAHERGRGVLQKLLFFGERELHASILGGRRSVGAVLAVGSGGLDHGADGAAPSHFAFSPAGRAGAWRW